MASIINIIKGEFKCTIETPQFLGSQDKFYLHRQSGKYNKRTGKFTPHEFKNGNHIVYVGDKTRLKDFLISVDD